MARTLTTRKLAHSQLVEELARKSSARQRMSSKDTHHARASATSTHSIERCVFACCLPPCGSPFSAFPVFCRHSVSPRRRARVFPIEFDWTSRTCVAIWKPGAQAPRARHRPQVCLDIAQQNANTPSLAHATLLHRMAAHAAARLSAAVGHFTGLASEHPLNDEETAKKSTGPTGWELKRRVFALNRPVRYNSLLAYLCLCLFSACLSAFKRPARSDYRSVCPRRFSFSLLLFRTCGN